MLNIFILPSPEGVSFSLISSVLVPLLIYSQLIIIFIYAVMIYIYMLDRDVKGWRLRGERVSKQLVGRAETL